MSDDSEIQEYVDKCDVGTKEHRRPGIAKRDRCGNGQESLRSQNTGAVSRGHSDDIEACEKVRSPSRDGDGSGWALVAVLSKNLLDSVTYPAASAEKVRKILESYRELYEGPAMDVVRAGSEAVRIVGSGG